MNSLVYLGYLMYVFNEDNNISCNTIQYEFCFVQFRHLVVSIICHFLTGYTYA